MVPSKILMWYLPANKDKVPPLHSDLIGKLLLEQQLQQVLIQRIVKEIRGTNSLSWSVIQDYIKYSNNVQTPAFRSCHRSIRGIRVCITTGGDILAVSSCSLVPSPPCDWNVNSKPLKRAASKPTEGSWQVGSKWSRQQEDTSTFYTLTLSIALQIFQSTHNLHGRPWLGCPDT